MEISRRGIPEEALKATEPREVPHGHDGVLAARWPRRASPRPDTMARSDPLRKEFGAGRINQSDIRRIELRVGQYDF
jgi:hypothetical protein